MLLSGCLGTRHLEEGEKLLLNQRIRGNENIDRESLEGFYLQEPNKKIPFLPFANYVWLYHWGENMYDDEEYRLKKEQIRQKFEAKIEKAEKESKKERLRKKLNKKTVRIDRAIQEGNLLMRWGEPVAVYDSTLTYRTIDQMKLYLESKGYFYSDVTIRQLEGKKTVELTYVIEEGKPHIIDSLFYRSPDTTILSLIRRERDQSFINKGDNYDQEKLAAERNRLDKLLKDNGYYAFDEQYITYDVDTTIGDYKTAIRINILTPEGQIKHKKYYIDSVIWITDTQYSFPNLTRQTEIYNGVKYKYFEKKYKKGLLDKRLFIYPDSAYSLENALNTQRQLANLDIFKFINISYDSTGSNFIANIFTSPLKKKDLSLESGLNVTEGVPGPFINASYRIRNFLKGLEILELTGRFGFDGIGTAIREVDFTFNEFFNNPRQFWNLEAGIELSLTFPQFILPLSERFKSRIGRIDPKTRILTGFAISDRQNEYRRERFSFNINYLWENQRGDLFTFSPFYVNRNNTNITSEDFRQRLEELESQGNNLIKSFDNSLVTSMVLTGILNVKNYRAPTQEQNMPFYTRFMAESGGTFLNFLNLQSSSFTSYQFFRGEVDIRKFLNDNRNVVFKARMGAAYPYANTFANQSRITNPDSITLPYEKFFFAGGSNSIRAWRPRRLGPGSRALPLDANGLQDYSFEQPGEFLIETSLEFRKRLFGFVHGAFFVDAGNVWTLRRDAIPPGFEGSTIFDLNNFNFINQFAVGSGVGVRFDFSFLLLRLDMGIKMHDPSRSPGERFVLPLVRFDGKQNIRADYQKALIENEAWTPPTVPVFNLGVGLPF